MERPAVPDAAVPDALLAALDTAVLERTGPGAFRVLGAVPEPVAALLDPGPDGAVRPAEASPFLENFLVDAQAAWADGAEPVKSEPWTEAAADGAERPLEALALRAAGRDLLLIRPPSLGFDAMQRVLQTAREQALDYQLTRREIEEREVLLHCVVHDLSGPLAGIRSGLQLLDARGHVEGSGDEVLAITREQAERMQTMIGGILRAFEAEVAALVPGSALATDAEAHAAARVALSTLAARAAINDVTLEVDPAEGGPVEIAGDEEHLERMLINLVDNALRHSPRGGTVRVEIREDGEWVTLAVEDEGPGVPADQRPDLFKKFSQGPTLQGQAGLGLYFCRITAEAWGGSITVEDAPSGGARFVLRLPKAPEAA